MKIYAHRGASFDCPEMSLAAYLEAIAQNADGFECDLRLTKDNVIVAWHDADLVRIADSPLVIADSTYAELIAAYPILRLEEILDLAIAHRKDLALETKHPVPSRGKVEVEIAALLKSRASEIEAARIDIVLMSFSWRAVARAKMLGLQTVFLSTHWLPLRLARGSYAGPSIASLRKNASAAKRLQSKQVFVWTVDTKEDAWLAVESGVDVIITNRPAFIRSILRNA